MIRKITFLLPVLVVFFSSKALAQCALLSNPDTCDYYNHLSGPATAQTPCQTTVPHWCVDFTTGPQTFTSPSVPRLGNCCGTASPDRCANFVFCIGPNTAAVRFEICAGPSPPGSLNFNIDCGPPQDIRTLGCISTPGQHTLSFCKPGNNPNGYCLTAIPKPTQLVDDSIRIGCYDTLTYSGVHVTGSSWNSIFPGVPGQYNSYLSAPFAHIPDSSSSVIITPTAGAPAFIDYRVCGQAVAKDCIGPVTFCDTIRVYIFSSLAISIADTAKYCAGQGGVNLCPVISGGVTPYTYLWSTGATTACLFASSPGLYTVTVNDHLSAPTKCGPSVKTVRVLLDSINIIQNQTNDSCFGQCNGTINIGVTGGTSPYTYSWSDIGAGSPNRTGLCFGTYTVTVTDNGAACIGTASITITQPAVLAVVIDSIKNVGCNGEATGAVFIHPTGGTNPVTYQWSSGQITEDITGIGAGTYTVTITDALGCTATASQVISEPFVLVPLITSVSINGNDVSCWLAADDSSCASVTGGTAPFTYFWTPGDSTGSCVTGMGGGIIICVTVTDANGCTGDACHMLSQPDSLYLTVDAISSYFGGYNISCNGFTDGSIDIGTTGGTPPYIYDWSDIAGTPPPDEGEDRFGIVAGVYTVTVTDLNNCSATISVTLTEPPVLYDSIVSPVSAGGYNIICRGECNGTITTNTTGGTIPYSYQWTPNVSSTNSALNLCAGSYTVTVTDANGCSFTDTLTLTEPDTVFALITVVDLHNGTPITCDGECDGSVYVTASGGSPPYTYSWTYTPPTVPAYSATGDTIYNLCAGLVTVVVSDLNGCSAPADTLINAPPPMLVSISAVTFVAGWNEPCFGDCVDSATATITGGTSPYTYLWSNAQASQTATGLCAITYTVTVTDVNNCSATAEIDLFEPPPLSLTLDSTIYACGYNVSCVGACDGAIDLTVSGGTAPFTYLWSNSDVNEDISSLCAGTYTVTVTDANNCTVSQSITLTSPTAVTIDSITSPTFAGGWNVSCNAGEDGCVNTGISGGCPPYVFAWSNGDTTQNICNLSVTIYILTVTDANGCTATDSIILTEPPPLTDTLVAILYDTTNISCNGACDGSVTATPAGGTPPYSYVWDSGCVTQTCTLLCAGIYHVTITDANGCFVNDSITLNEPPLPLSVTLTNTGISCDTACANTITAHALGGTAPYVYCWSSSGPVVPCPGPDSLNNICIATYTITVTDLNGCTATASYTFSSAGTPININLSSTNNSCNAACNDTIIATPATGTAPYTYTWSPAAPNSPNYYGACIGTYTVTVTDVNGCSGTASITLISSPVVINISFTPSNYNGWGVTCNGACDGSILATPTSGLAPYSYLWSTSAITQTINGLCAGTYTVTVTDANGCIGTDSFTITEPPLLTATLAGSIFSGGWGVSCNGVCDDTLTTSASGGTLPYTYTWSPPGPNNQLQTGICAGTYTVTVTDVNGCSASASFIVTEPPILTITLAGSNFNGWGEPCSGDCLDTLTSSAAGGTLPYSYTWSNGGPNNPVQTNICAGTYTVTVTDANGCTASASFIVTEPPLLAISLTGSNFNGWGEPCNGDCLDTLTSTATGGTLPYVYSWSNAGPNNPVQTGICAGTYTVTVTDVNGCTASASFVVTEPPVLTVTLTGSNFNGWGEPCNGNCLDTLTTAASGGTLPYTYTWSNGGPNNPVQTGICAGTYTVTVTDVNGCTASASFVVTEPPLLAVTLTGSNFNGWGEPCNGSCLDTLTTAASGGTLPYTYTWSNGGPNNPVQTGICAGTYTVTVTDANGCTATASFIVTEPPAMAVTLTGSNFNGWGEPCNGSCLDTLTTAASGGTLPYTYTWSNAGPNNPVQTGICAGTYTVTVTDANGCTVSASFVVTEPPVLSVTLTGSNFNGWGEPCNGNCLDTLTTTASGGTLPYIYTWSNGGPNNPVQTGICAGTYTVTVTDVNGCTASASFIVTEPPVLTVVLTDTLLNPPFNNSCPGSCDAWILATASGGTLPYSYVWSNGDSTALTDSLCAGLYTVTITDANGCIRIDTLTITDPLQPTAVAGPDQSICANSTTLIANVPLPFYSAYWYVVSGSAIFSPDSLSNVVQVSNLSWGTNTFVWFVGDTLCIARDTIIIQATEPVIAIADKYPNICEGDEPVHLHANTNYTGIGTWSVIPSTSSLSFDNPNDPNTFASNFGWGSNTVVWTVVDGPCRDADTVKIIKLIPEVCDSTLLEMPTGFSPNGDGDNDHFVIHGIEYSYNRINKFTVFNRWGNEVYSKENYLNEWFGQNKSGGLLADGTYFVILRITNPGINQGRVLKGYVDLRR